MENRYVSNFAVSRVISSFSNTIINRTNPLLTAVRSIFNRIAGRYADLLDTVFSSLSVVSTIH